MHSCRSPLLLSLRAGLLLLPPLAAESGAVLHRTAACNAHPPHATPARLLQCPPCVRRSYTDTALTFMVVMLNAAIDLVSFSGGWRGGRAVLRPTWPAAGPCNASCVFKPPPPPQLESCACDALSCW
jgi:hypothetical protein